MIKITDECPNPQLCHPLWRSLYYSAWIRYYLQPQVAGFKYIYESSVNRQQKLKCKYLIFLNFIKRKHKYNSLIQRRFRQILFYYNKKQEAKLYK
jgi:hypothetical protein